MNYFCSTIIDRPVETAHKIEVSSHSSVYIGNAERLLAELLPDRRVIVITDANIDRRYHPLFGGRDYFLIGTGETVKTLNTVNELYRKLIEAEADRSCFILGVGGGIVTDIAGYAASTYMRGLEFGFVSTTLLGQVDASVGGKNGVNIDGYKNMVGTFSQPRFVICDTEMLKTLPEREFRAGMAEIIKAAAIADAELFEMLEQNTLEGLRRDERLLADIVKAAVKIKAEIVQRDEREKGERRKLNLGHTLGHAIEKCTPALNHGEAVAAGLAGTARAAARLGALAEQDAERIISLLQRYGFDLSIPVSQKRLVNAIAKDKKMSGEFLHLVLPTGIGSCEVRCLPKNEAADYLIAK